MPDDQQIGPDGQMYDHGQYQEEEQSMVEESPEDKMRQIM